ncbi:MAG: hypothetical protein DI610_08620, partial [Staphylococcus hominis]
IGIALKGIPEEFRAPILLVDMGDLTYAEAAEILSCPIGTVRSRLSVARSRERTGSQAGTGPKNEKPGRTLLRPRLSCRHPAPASSHKLVFRAAEGTHGSSGCGMTENARRHLSGLPRAPQGHPRAGAPPHSLAASHFAALSGPSGQEPDPKREGMEVAGTVECLQTRFSALSIPAQPPPPRASATGALHAPPRPRSVPWRLQRGRGGACRDVSCSFWWLSGRRRGWVGSRK